jgi:2,4-dienoyl-CoA reductase-like NADH-dependent reductase (Old Yellow Enzyme family)
MNPYDLVQRPLTIKNLVIPNRIVFPPFVTGYSHPDGSISDRQIKFYKSISKGGAGMVIVGATAVAPEGMGWMGNTAIYNDSYIPGLKRLFDETKTEKNVIGIQLYHCGILTNSKRTNGLPLVAPSSLEYPDKSAIAHELTIEEIQSLETAFAEAAQRAFSAGADFIEIHAAHGYLIDQFLSPLTNKRTDRYGGSLENRSRFALNIMDKIRLSVGKDPVVGVRISADEFLPGGYTLSDSKIFCKWFAEKGMDFIHVSARMNEKGVEEMFAGTFVRFSAAIRKEVNAPVICVGAIKNLERAEEILSEGSADLVAIGRALVADPDMVNKSLAGNHGDMVECVDCFGCFMTMSDDNGNGMECTQNSDLP